MRRELKQVLALSALGILLSAGPSAFADPPAVANAHAEKADKAENKADTKAENKPEKTDKTARADARGAKDLENPDAKKEIRPAPEQAQKADERGAEGRATASVDRDNERKRVEPLLHGQPMSEALRQELRQHARRMARLERAKALAIEAKDKETTERVEKLIEKETARHDRFLAKLGGSATAESPTNAKSAKAGAL